MGSGVDPHLYKPTRDDVVRLRHASLLFYNGLHLEGKNGSCLSSAAINQQQQKLAYRDWSSIVEPGFKSKRRGNRFGV